MLIVFVKNPVLGKVKSRLAKSIGREKALFVYKRLLWKTREIVLNVKCDKLICYSDFIEEKDIWDNEIFWKGVQRGADLGERMFNSIQMAADNRYEKICLIGSDNLELSSKILVDAFESLEKFDFVIGPAKDGGYYLIGMKQPNKNIFKDKAWGTNLVLEQTIRNIDDLGLKVNLLPELNDIDEIDDISPPASDYLLP